MLLNENAEVIGDKVALVPYTEDLVAKFHEWMTVPEIIELTRSEITSLDDEYEIQKSWRTRDDLLSFIIVDKKVKEEADDLAAMIGDVNFVIIEPKVAEVMIMIAETRYRRRGFGREALLLMLRYGIEELGLERFEAKIDRSNIPSGRLFQSVGFEKVYESDVFDEITMVKTVTEEWKKSLSNLTYFLIYI